MEGKGATCEDVYAYALSRALIQIAPPATVGLYCRCENRIETLLKKIKIYMEREAERRDQKYKAHGSCRGFLRPLVILFSMLFLRPVWTVEGDRSRRRVRWISVRFSAWHFAGSDRLWAGLVIRLFKAVHDDFGGLAVSLYRTVQDPYPKRFHQHQSRSNWSVRKVCGVPIWLIATSVTALCVGLTALLCISHFQIVKNGTMPGISSMESAAIATLGLPALMTIRFVLTIGKNLLYSQGGFVQMKMNVSALSNQLGFMDTVRKEVAILINLIHFMEVVEDRKIRVVMEITNLDRCCPEKIIQTLEAINILLTGENVPFVLILGVDPRVVVNCVESSVLPRRSTSGGYGFLNKIVTVPFSVPEMTVNSKNRLFETLAKSHLEVFSDRLDDTVDQPRMSGENEHLRMEEGLPEGSWAPFNEDGIEVITQGTPWENWTKKVKARTNGALQFVNSRGNLNDYIMADHMCMRRIINSVRVSIIIQEGMKCGLTSVEDLAAWVVLANLWPCRLSWILQVVEDDQQRASIDEPDGAGGFDEGKTLWEVFSESSVELHVLRGRAELLLEQDGDPELFEKFLKVDFRLVVGDACRFRAWTVNLDHSIQREMARLRGIHSRDKMNYKINASMPIRTLIRLSTEDICKEMQRLNFPEKYLERLRKSRLDGVSLAFGNNGEIKRALRMALGEWIAFSSHFLGAKPR